MPMPRVPPSSLQHWVWALLPSIAVLGAVANAHVLYAIEIPAMTRDVAALGQLPPWAGAVSSLGVLLWCVTAAVCAFAALAQRDALAVPVRRFLLCAALLSAYLTIDDAFQFHEDLSPRLLGVRERYVYLLLAGSVLAFLWVFRAVIARTHWPMLALALLLLGASALADTLLLAVLRDELGQWQFFVEDGLKWLGIACWCGYFVQTAAAAPAIAVQRQPAALTPPTVAGAVPEPQWTKTH